MTALSRDARLATWIAEEQAIRNQLAAPGTLSLAEVAAMTPMDFFDGIGRGGKERDETLEIRSLNNARAARGRKGKAADLGFKPNRITRVE